MNNLRGLLWMFILGSIFTMLSCNGDDDGGNFDPCPRNTNEDLVLTIQDQSVSAPARVSIFFKIDDKNGLPVPGLHSNQFTIYEKGRNDECENKISSFEANAVIRNRHQVFNYHTILVLDLSASVTATSLPELKAAANSFIDEVIPEESDEEFYMGIWWFDGEDGLHELVPVSTDRDVLKDAVNGISADISNDSSTDLYGAVIESAEQANNILSVYEQLDIISAVSVVIFTDGTDQAGRYLKSDALAAVNSSTENVRFFSIGLGEEIDETVLNQIGKNGFTSAANQAELENTFRQVADIIVAEANSFYLFEYCSPKRDGSGVNDLRIEAETGDGRIGSVLTQFDATGFTGGCN